VSGRRDSYKDSWLSLNLVLCATSRNMFSEGLMLALSLPQLFLFLAPIVSSSEGVGGMEACTTEPADLMAITKILRRILIRSSIKPVAL
jgi:hypothetical protein